MSDLSKQIANLPPDKLQKLIKQLAQQRQTAKPNTITPRPATLEALPLSFSQERLWLLDQLEPGNPAYHLAGVVRLTGSLDHAALQASLDAIMGRHEALRTRFAARDGQLIQHIAPAQPFALPSVDVSHLSETERNVALKDIIHAESYRSFDLAHDNLVRATLVRLASDEHVLVLVLHHIIADGWSLSIFSQEMGQLYVQYHQHQSATIPPLAVQYPDFAIWQREYLKGEVLERQVAYWRARLADAPPLLDLPLDYPRTVTANAASESIALHLPASVLTALRALSQATEATLYMVLLAAFKGLLSRLTGQEDIVVGTPIAGRHRRETEGLIGFFLNSLALRTDVSGSPSFREVVRRVRDTALGAYSHQDLPFERLLEVLQAERDMRYTPIFQVFFNMLNLPVTKMELAGLAVELLPSPEVGSKFDLTLYAEEVGDEVSLQLVYNEGLFSRARMQEFLAQYTQLVAAAAAVPDAPLDSHSLVTVARRPLLPDALTPLDASWHGSLPDALRHWATHTPNAVAIEGAGGMWRYSDLETCSNQLAHALRTNGVQTDDVVAVYAHRDGALVWAIMGILKAGAAFTILDPGYPETRLLTYMEVAQPTALIHLEAAGALPPALEAWTAGVACRYHGRLPAAPTTSSPLNEFPTEPPAVTFTPTSFACLTFTSGSTGNPKGVIGQHGSLTHFYPWMAQHFGLGPSDRFSMVSGLAHDPLQRDIFTPLWLGGTICIPAAEDMNLSGRLALWMAQAGITVATLTPALGQMLSETVSPNATQIPSLRYAFIVGDVLTRRDVTRIRALAPAITCINLYGSTETQRAVGYYPVPDSLIDADDDTLTHAKEVLALGKGMPDVQLLVLNQTQQMAGTGELGEIYIRSPHISRGYLREASLTAQKFLKNPFDAADEARLYRTGDLGRYRPDGDVEFAGRADLQVQIRGFRIELGEIEGVVRQQERVRDAVVIVREDLSIEGKHLVAYIVPQQADQPPTTAELFGHVKAILPTHMVPSTFVTLQALPLTPNRKIDRRALPRPELSVGDSGAFTAPRTPMEEIIAGIWAEVLGLKRIGVHDNFFESGGHSLLAMRVVTRLRDQLQLDLPFRRLFEAPTVAQLTRVIEEMQVTSHGMKRPTLQPVPHASAFFPLSFTQQRLWFLYQMDPTSPFYNISVAVRVEGNLNTVILNQAVADLMLRHEALRTTFVLKGSTPQQEIHATMPMICTEVDLRTIPAADRTTIAEQRAHAEVLTPFDLGQGPLWRLVVIQVEDALYTLQLTIHHIIADGWSMSVFTRDLLAFYEARLAEHASRLEALPIQYADYAVWQRDWLQGEALDAQVDYWKARLQGAPPLLSVRTDNPRPAVQSFAGAAEPVHLSTTLAEAIRTLCQQEGATLFMGLLATFNVLLRWLSDMDDFVIGTDVAGRDVQQTEELVGCFVNQLPLRATFSGDPTFRAFLTQTRNETLDAYSHQDVPFDKLVEALNPPRANYTPLVQIKLVLHNLPRTTLELPDLTFLMIPIERGTAQLDFQINLGESEAGVEGVLEYNTALFGKRTAARLVSLYTNLLETVTTAPETPLSALAVQLNQHLRTLEVAEQEQFKQARRVPIPRRGRATD